MKSLLFSLALFLCFTTVSAQTRYYMDVHKLEPGKVHYHDVAGAHEKDLATQEKYGVKFITYWVDEAGGNVYCLSSADKAADVKSTHAEAHGLVPAEIYEVVSGEQAAYTGNGTLYMDIHELQPGGVSPADVEAAHQKDLAVEGKHKVHFINYWNFVIYFLILV